MTNSVVTMAAENSSRLNARQLMEYRKRGYIFPVRVYDEAETDYFRERFFDYREQLGERVKDVPPRDQYVLFSETHTFLHWVYQMATHPRLLDAVESLLGPDLLIWNSRWFAKMPGDQMYISWHQDAAYWGLWPPHAVTTAWIALTDSTPENGSMRVIPGTHLKPALPQKDTYAPDNALSRGQEIVVEVDESLAVDFVLRPGEISLHHIGIVHGSRVNTSVKPRIGLAVRFITPEVSQDGPVRQIAMLVRGQDKYGHFDLIEPPQTSANSANDARQSEAVRRLIKNLVPDRDLSQ